VKNALKNQRLFEKKRPQKTNRNVKFQGRFLGKKALKISQKTAIFSHQKTRSKISSFLRKNDYKKRTKT
jgi:hypothetical protein